MATDLEKIAKERKIKYFLISYVDLFGGQMRLGTGLAVILAVLVVRPQGLFGRPVARKV